MLDGIILLAAQAIGGARHTLDLTVQYAKDREQFDKPLGAFQAIAHYLADAATAVDGGELLVYEAAWAARNGQSIDRLAPMAKLFACKTFRDVTAMAQQVFGGVGFTVEYDIQLFFRRAKSSRSRGGTTASSKSSSPVLRSTDMIVPPLLRRMASDEYTPLPWSTAERVGARARATRAATDAPVDDRRTTAATLRALDAEHGGSFYDVPDAAVDDLDVGRRPHSTATRPSSTCRPISSIPAAGWRGRRRARRVLAHGRSRPLA